MLRFPVIWKQVEGGDSLVGSCCITLLMHTHTMKWRETKTKPTNRDFQQVSSDKKKPILSSVQLLSHVEQFVTPWTAVCQASLLITNTQSLLKLMSIKSVMQSNHLILCCSLLLLPSIFSSIRVYSSESVLRIRWPKCWSFRVNISPSSEHSGQISFRIDWFESPAVQGTLKILLQHKS